MVIVEPYPMAVGMCVITILCWGWWANTQKLASKEWWLQLFSWNYTIGAFLLSFTMGRTDSGERGFLGNSSERIAIAGQHALISARFGFRLKESSNRIATMFNTTIFHSALVSMLILAAGCQRNDNTKPRVALVMKSLANEFFLTMENGARAHQKAHAADYDLLVNGIKDELDVSRQIDLVEQMIAQNVSALVIAPADSKSLVPVCKKAQQAGIIVVNIDNKFDDAVLAASGLKVPFVGPDNRKGARGVGELLAKKLKAGDQVAIIEGAPNAFNGIQRKAGFEDAMKAAGMNIVASQSGYWETDKANAVVAAMLTEHRSLKAVLCANDSMALGAVAALRAAGKQDQVLVVGYDGIGAVRQLLKEGKVLATADQHADQLAVFGIEYALEMLKTKSAPADRDTPVDMVTAP